MNHTNGFHIKEQVKLSNQVKSTYHYVICKCGEWSYINPETLKLTVNKIQVHECEFCGVSLPKVTVRGGHYAFRYIPKLKYLGQCDRLRKKSQFFENLWHRLMDNKIECDEQFFLNNVDVSILLDDGETWEQWKESASFDIKYFSCNGYYFIQSNGFEFIWG